MPNTDNNKIEPKEDIQIKKFGIPIFFVFLLITIFSFKYKPLRYIFYTVLLITISSLIYDKIKNKNNYDELVTGIVFIIIILFGFINEFISKCILSFIVSFISLLTITFLFDLVESEKSKYKFAYSIFILSLIISIIVNYNEIVNFIKSIL